MDFAPIMAGIKAIIAAGQEARLLSTGVELEVVILPVIEKIPIGTVIRSIPHLSAADKKSIRLGLHNLVDLIMDCEDNATAASLLSNAVADAMSAPKGS